MSDEDLDLKRLFAETTTPEDNAFVAGVTRRIVQRKRLALAVPAALAALLVTAIWATWPAAYLFSVDALSGLMLIAGAVDDFFMSPAGMLAAAVLFLTAAGWAWEHERIRGARL